MMALPDLSALAVPGARIALRAQPGARRNAIEPGDPIRAWVTDPPEAGRANAALRRMLAKAMGVAPSRLVLEHGQGSRDKVFRLTG